MNSRILRMLGCLALLSLNSCSFKATYDKVPATGRFSGEPRMVSIAPNTFFFFKPKKDEPFTFTTHAEGDPALNRKHGRGKYRKAGWRICPEDMITTGASVPRQLWYVPGFAAFDFTRAALIHDWLFEAHHRYEMAKAGYAAAEKRGDQSAMDRNENDLAEYGAYADLTQNDAADILAECLKATMLETQRITEDFDRLEQRQDNAGQIEHKPATLKGLRAALRYNRPRPSTLWFYHYFVSDDCLTKASTRTWNDHSSDVDIYRVLGSETMANRALERGYLSPWLIRRFQSILSAEKKRHDDYERAKADAAKAAELAAPKLVPILPKPALPKLHKRGERGHVISDQ